MRYIYLCTVVIWCTAMGTDNPCPTALCGGGPIWDGCLPEGWLSPCTTN